MIGKKFSRFIFASSLFSFAVAGASSTAHAGKIESIQIKNVGQQEMVEINGTGISAYDQENKTNPPQLVLTFDKTQIDTAAAKKYDASAFAGNLLQISAYAVDEKTRVVIDFKKPALYSFDRQNGKVLVKLENADEINAAVAEAPLPPSSQSTVITMSGTEPTNTADDAITTVVNGQATQKFTGSPITLKLKDADVHDVLRLIGEASGFNVVIHPSVQGKLTVSLEQVPWDQALDVVLTTLRLGAERTDNVLRVLPRDALIAEKQSEIESKRLSATAAPRVTRIFPISYEDLSALASLLQTFANSQNTTPGASGIPTTIIVDQNTQSLVVRDTIENIERIRKMIEILDVQTPQVMIETKVVEATETFDKELNGNTAIGLFPGNQLGLGFNGGTLGGVTPTSALGFGAAGSVVSHSLALSAALNLSEKESKVRVISSPRVAVLSGKSSTINQSQSVAIQVTTPATATSPPTTALQTVTANTKLTVTPRVTNDGSVFMKLDLNRDVLDLSNPTLPAVQPREITTEVIVESGNTLVIGGVLSNELDSSEQGIPYLRNIPLLGWLFGSSSHTGTKTELMFFVTPRILNQKKAGITDVATDETPPAKL
jgi:type IV pilus assembly protein PilQ